ncbi:hypothetical protein HPP92_026387 [Vanilla planifolia]|uniref:Calmodulin-binding family protein n=1 Tax=Vanilla planifolia TaxID=51239 RepID=A0A835PDP5_VANPL|nr:hypothetical protein HPP92_026387 [Vanilla planifolia]
MGITFSSAGEENKALNEGFDALLGSISFRGDYAKSNLCSDKADGGEAESPLMRALGSGKFLIEGSVSFSLKETDPFRLETKISFKSSSPTNAESLSNPRRTRFSEENVETPRAELGSPKHEAAVKLQKVYKSFRTRRQLADCAVLVEQSWWKLLDFALLKRSSVSFFDIEKPESAVSKWARARTRAAKVGKGLSKNSKARKLSLQHWLEAIDPRHRYGHNLHFYYACWLGCESKQPFFYWLDVGEGKEVNLEACTRSKLQQQCIKYLGPKEREAYEVIVEEGRLRYKKSGDLLHTTGGPKDSKWIFVLSTSKNLYVGLKRKGTFQHSSFLAGGAAAAAGRLVVENGVLKAVWAHSGHYRPTEENFEEFVSFLKENNIDLHDVKTSPDEDEEECGGVLRSRKSEADLTDSAVYVEPKFRSHVSSNSFDELDMGAIAEVANCSEEDHPGLEKFYSFKEGTMGDQGSEEHEEKGVENSTDSNQDYETPEPSGHKGLIFPKPSLFIPEVEEGEDEPISEELIMQTISSRKVNSDHLGQQLPFKWTTGAGPRIGYVRNYPSELQFRALEQVSLSPRGTGFSRPFSSPRGVSSPRPRMQETSNLKESILQR